MPIVVGTPPATLTATSSDGVLVAATRSYASVGVDVNWNAAAGAIPWTTTVTRTVTGATVNVRSGDRCYTPGGAGYVYDHEAPLEGTIVYQAYGYDANGVLVRTSATVALNLPALPGESRIWLKAISNPSLSMSVLGSVQADRSRPFEAFKVPGQRTGPRWVDVMSGRSGTLSVATVTAGERDSLRKLVEEADLLVQCPAAQGVPDMYITVTAEKEAPVGPRAGGVTRWQYPFTEGTRPSTIGSRLRIPGWTNDVVAANYATYAALDAAFPTYLARGKGP